MKTINAKLASLAELYNQLSASAFVAICVHKAIRKLSKKNALHYYHFYRQPIEAPPARKSNRRSAFSFSWHESFSPAMLSLPRPETRLRERFRQKTACLLGTKGDQVVSCAWFAYQTYEEDEVWCRYDFSRSPESVWDYDIFVAPPYRMGRAFHLTWQSAAAALHAAGYRRTLSRISAYNPNSIKSHEKLGALRCGSAMYLKLWALQIMASNKSPYLHITASEKGRPVLYFE